MIQYWTGTGPSGQKMRFNTSSNGTYVLTKNPVKYNMVPMTKAQADIPVAPGPNLLNGVYEFAAASIPLEWEEMDYAEYETLQAYHLQYGTMIDMLDNGYYGYLVLGSFEFAPGVATKVGKVVAAFIVSSPANGVSSTVNVLSAPGAGNLTASVTTGGIIPASTTLYYCLTFSSNWGETTISPVLTVSTGATSNAAIAFSWTAPTSNYYRKASLYVSSSPGALVAGASGILVKADTYSGWNQQYTDYCGTSGVTSTRTLPSTNMAATGYWAGGVWKNST